MSLFGDDCPTWLDAEAWAEYKRWRQSLPKKQRATDYALTLILKELDRIRLQGYCPTAALQQSMRSGWLDVWPDKKQVQSLEKREQEAPRHYTPADETKRYLESQRSDPDAIRAAARRFKERRLQ